MIRISALSVSRQQRNLIPLIALMHHQSSPQIFIGYALVLMLYPKKHLSNFILPWKLEFCSVVVVIVVVLLIICY